MPEVPLQGVGENEAAETRRYALPGPRYRVSYLPRTNAGYGRSAGLVPALLMRPMPVPSPDEKRRGYTGGAANAPAETVRDR